MRPHFPSSSKTPKRPSSPTHLLWRRTASGTWILACHPVLPSRHPAPSLSPKNSILCKKTGPLQKEVRRRRQRSVSGRQKVRSIWRGRGRVIGVGRRIWGRRMLDLAITFAANLATHIPRPVLRSAPGPWDPCADVQRSIHGPLLNYSHRN
jgi:hypothetical protein